ncbi:MAG TPA: sulfite exporter TauE/SafE family protein [Candidatus Acidoferrales bacterium]|nr:sulfite exporter TauE/SafE family protein [Candidatus Acidoferrales bacterium]
MIAVMGFLLGLLGGGGSMLTVPILVYVLGVDAHVTIFVSLIIVGSTALLAGFLHQQRAQVAWNQGLLFVAAGTPLNFLGASVSWRFPGTLLLILFGVLMCVSGMAMLRRRANLESSSQSPTIWLAVVSGACVGFLAGFLGVGGGFLIVPSLVLFLHMPMKLAAGTSLLVIACNSMVALLARRHAVEVDWTLILELVPVALLATCLGVQLSEKFSGLQLRKAFGVFVILLGFFMVVSNATTLANLRATDAQAVKSSLLRHFEASIGLHR